MAARASASAGSALACPRSRPTASTDSRIVRATSMGSAVYLGPSLCWAAQGSGHDGAMHRRSWLKLGLGGAALLALGGGAAVALFEPGLRGGRLATPGKQVFRSL